jgi:hypothetical protein
MAQADPRTAELRTFLLSGRNADGGWGYYAGKASRLEPTCWAVLALGADPGPLTRWPSSDGLLLERRDGAVNFGFHALALLTLTAVGVEHERGNPRLAVSLQSAKGIALDDPAGSTPINRQNNRLQGWSWIDGVFSWVEPTAWALLALRKRAAAGQRMDGARLAEAEALLVDRCCEQGGWNYGNSNMLGKELRPYVPTTAIALLSLQHRDHAVVARSLDFLSRAAVSEVSAAALALATLALQAHGREAAAPRATLAAHSERAVDLGQQLGAAMALYALRSEAGDGAFIF